MRSSSRVNIRRGPPSLLTSPLQWTAAFILAVGDSVGWLAGCCKQWTGSEEGGFVRGPPACPEPAASPSSPCSVKVLGLEAASLFIALAVLVVQLSRPFSLFLDLHLTLVWLLPGSFPCLGSDYFRITL